MEIRTQQITLTPNGFDLRPLRRSDLALIEHYASDSACGDDTLHPASIAPGRHRGFSDARDGA